MRHSHVPYPPGIPRTRAHGVVCVVCTSRNKSCLLPRYVARSSPNSTCKLKTIALVCRRRTYPKVRYAILIYALTSEHAITCLVDPSPSYQPSFRNSKDPPSQNPSACTMHDGRTRGSNRKTNPSYGLRRSRSCPGYGTSISNTHTSENGNRCRSSTRILDLHRRLHGYPLSGGYSRTDFTRLPTPRPFCPGSSA